LGSTAIAIRFAAAARCAPFAHFALSRLLLFPDPPVTSNPPSLNEAPKKTETLGFSVTVVQDESDLQAAREVRAAAYGRVVPELGQAMLAPDALDQRADVVVLLAREKLSGKPIGTARIATNDGQPLLIQQCFELPHQFIGLHLGEVTRLAVHPDNDDQLVRMGLLKALFLVCKHRNIDQVVVGVRRPGLVRNYRYLGFDTLSTAPVALAYAGGLDHHVMAFNTRELVQKWRTSAHPWYEWGIETVHPDIRIASDDLVCV
jgi:hypothetical protein